MNISGILVQTKAENVKEVFARLETSGLSDVYTHDEFGRIVVVIEGKNIDEEMKKLEALTQIEGVITADMHYSYSEDELQQARNEFEQSPIVPAVLEADISAEKIKYNGDLRKQKL